VFGGTASTAGIVNSGLINAFNSGILVFDVASFAGGITNLGTIVAGVNGIVVGGSAFGITNTIATFGGGISNSGTISAAASAGIFVGGTAIGHGAITISAFSGDISNSGAISSTGANGIAVGGLAASHSTVTIGTFGGGITNAGGGTITAARAGIMVGGTATGHQASVVISSFGGNISNSGTITARTGIAVGGFARTGDSVTISNFSGGISNNSQIVATGAGAVGILVAGTNFPMAPVTISTFGGGIVNSGTISATSADSVGIDVVQVKTFLTGITNSGLITVGASGAGIVAGATHFGGNISNSGTITGGETGIFICDCMTFAGGSIVNTGVISGSTDAINTVNATSAITINQNAGTLTGQIALSAKADVLNINGGTVVGNIVGRGSLDTVNFSLTAPGTYTENNTFTGIHQVNVDSGTTLVLKSSGNLATNLTVNNGGTFAGNGTVSAAVVVNSGGTLEGGLPGTVGGTLGITGSLDFVSGANYRDTLSTSAASATLISGSATLGGATVSIDAGSSISAGVQYTILTDTAGGIGIGGNTFSPTVTFGGLIGELSYNADDVFLTFLNSNGCYIGPYPHTNTFNIACMIVSSNVAGDIGNSGTISAGGITVLGSTITGHIFDSGIIAGGILLDGTSKLLVATGNAISITGSSFGGGITNGGTISAGAGTAIAVNGTTTFGGGITNIGTLTAALAGIAVQNVSSFSGNISNAGAITAATGIKIAGSTINGSIIDTGNIFGSSHGITVDSASKITSATSGIVVSGSTFTGGISNAGTISAGGNAAIRAADSVVSFAGGISNAGALIALATGIFVGATTFGGGVSNSGTITGGNVGIGIDTTVKTFSGGIANSGKIVSTNGKGINLPGVQNFSGGITNAAGGTISANLSGIFVSGATFAGGISNAGLITGGAGIVASHVAVFGPGASGGITNTGTMSVNGVGIGLASVSTFTGNISNGGMISAKTGIGLLSSTLTGAIVDSGTLLASRLGIGIDSHSTINSVSTAIKIAGSTFTGGINNAGTITAAIDAGVLVANVVTFLGGIINNAGGSINGPSNAISVTGVVSFAGGISNAGTISSFLDAGITVQNVTTFASGISNSGTISSHEGITLGNITAFSGNVSNAGGIIAGTGIVIQSGVTFSGGAVVNTGSITGGHGTAIDASAATSAVTIDQNAGTITGAIKLSANADFLNINGGTIAGNITGLGSLDTVNFQLGSGTTYTDSNNFTGINQVNINSGTVLLNGTDTATNIDVFSGATLGGTGTLDPNLTIHGGGIFAPGVPGTLMQVTGSLTLQSAAIYMVTVNGVITSGANVTGGTTIDTGAVARASAGSTPPVIGTKYTILTSTGGVSGTFADSTFFFGRYEGILSYDLDDVFMTVQNGVLVLPPGAPQNVVNVANGINSAIAGGSTLPQNFQNLFNYTPAQLQTALNELSGQDNTGAATSTFQLMNDFLNLLSDMTFGAGGGGGTGGVGAPGFAATPEDAFPSDVAMAYRQALKQSAPASFDQRWTAWGAGFGGSGSYNGNAVVGSNNLTAGDYGFAGGMDYHATPDLKLGFALDGAGTNWSLAQNLGGGRSDALQIAGYGIKHYGPAYISGMAAFGNSWFTTNRTAVLGDQLQAKFDGQSYALRGEAGYRYAVMPTAGLTPYAALQTQWFHTPGYSETDLNGGGFALSYNALTANDTRSEFGARADDLTMLGASPLVLRGRVAWAHDWVSDPALGAVFQTLPGSAFAVNGAAVPKNSALASVGGQLYFTPNWSFEAKFDGEFASSAQTYSGSGTLRYSW
jgi:uncharacterized protein with beta-barrel porin domain